MPPSRAFAAEYDTGRKLSRASLTRRHRAPDAVTLAPTGPAAHLQRAFRDADESGRTDGVCDLRTARGIHHDACGLRDQLVGKSRPFPRFAESQRRIRHGLGAREGRLDLDTIDLFGGPGDSCLGV